MKIYIVTCGEYSDYCILAAFLDKTKAEAFAQKYNRVDQQYDKANIEEYEDGVPFDFETMNIYAVRFYDNGTHDIVKKELQEFCTAYKAHVKASMRFQAARREYEEARVALSSSKEKLDGFNKEITLSDIHKGEEE